MANQISGWNDTYGSGNRAGTQGSVASKPLTMERATREGSHLEGRSTSPSGGLNDPQGMSKQSTRQIGLIVTMLHEITRSAGHGSTFTVVKVFDCIRPRIMAAGGSEWSSSGSGSGSPTVAGVSFFTGTYSVSKSEDPKIARFNEVFGANADLVAEAVVDATTGRLAGWIGNLTVVKLEDLLSGA